MTAEAMSSLPLQAGSAVAAAAGRAALWCISTYMRQPLRNTALAALIGLSATAGANALYKQAHHHPAPLFGSFAPAQGTVTKKVAPVMPAAKPPRLTQTISPETTGSVDEPAATPAALATIGNDDVMAMQQKLASLGMFVGTPDGIFGPRTAKAIKAFEASVGKTPRGLLTAANLAMVKAAPMPAGTAPTLAVQATVATTPLPTVVTATVRVPALAPAVVATPLPAPAPLLTTAQPQTAALPLVARTATDAVEQVATAETEDTTPGAETLAMTKPNLVAKRAVQTIAVRVAPAAAAPVVDNQAMPEQLAPATEGSDASSDTDVVASVQRGLNSLGFLHAPVDGVAGESTAKAIRNFEVYFNYDVTGRVTKQLVNLLEQNGAVI